MRDENIPFFLILSSIRVFQSKLNSKIHSILYTKHYIEAGVLPKAALNPSHSLMQYKTICSVSDMQLDLAISTS